MRCEITKKNCQKSKNSGKIVKSNNCEEKTNEPHVICKSSEVFGWWKDQEILPKYYFEGSFKQFTYLIFLVKLIRLWKVKSGDKIKLECVRKFAQIGEERSTRK